MRRLKSFTLIELIIVIIVIGILATIAIPQYLKVVERTKVSKAKHVLGLIAQAEKMYYAEKNTYTATLTGDDSLSDYVELDETANDPDWAYTAAGDASTFTATATRSGGTYGGDDITLDQVGTWGGSMPVAVGGYGS